MMLTRRKQRCLIACFQTEAVKTILYFTGDDDIINGIILASQYQNGDMYYVMYISD